MLITKAGKSIVMHVHSYFAWGTVKWYSILEKFGEFIPQIKTYLFHLIQWSISENLAWENNNTLGIYFYIKIFITTYGKSYIKFLYIHEIEYNAGLEIIIKSILLFWKTT